MFYAKKLYKILSFYHRNFYFSHLITIFMTYEEILVVIPLVFVSTFPLIYVVEIAQLKILLKIYG